MEKAEMAIYFDGDSALTEHVELQRCVDLTVGDRSYGDELSLKALTETQSLAQC